MILIVFLYGIIFGSFLNVCIYRIPNNQSVVTAPSHCYSCDHKLGWLDLIPLFSYIALRGRCRYCHAKVSGRYPLVEGLTGLLIVGIYLRYGISFQFFKYSLLALFLIVIAFIDFDTTDVYSSVIYTGIFLGVMCFIMEKILYSQNIIDYILGALIGLLVIGSIVLFTGGMGAGDIEIAVLCGVFLGWRMEIYFILASFIIGGAVAVLLIVAKKKKKTDYIPLGPSLALGAYTVMLLGENIVLKLIGIN